MIDQNERMTLEEALFDFCLRQLRHGTDWYPWEVDWQKVPSGIQQVHGNDYEQNVALRKALALDWQSASVSRRHALECYYMEEWVCGDRTHGPDKLNTYASNTDTANIALGQSDIACWSKALVVRDPWQCAIYDERIAFSLTALQIIYRVPQPVRFPLLQTRYPVIAERTPMLMRWMDENGWPDTASSFYATHLELCRKTVTRLQGELGNFDAQMYSVEMLLNAAPEHLLNFL